jgi:HK97 gp10 family phage protein
MAAEATVTGLSELQALLDTLAPKIEQNIMRGALRAGAGVIRDEAKDNCPTGAPSAENQRLYGAYLGALKDSIRAGSRAKNGVAIGYVRAGGKNSKGADAFWANFVEFGTGAHLIKPPVGAKAKALAFDGIVRYSVHHPGTVAKSYMRTAFDAKANEALIAVGEAIKARLTKEGLDAADVAIGDE